MADPSKVGNMLCSSPDRLADLRKTLADLKDCMKNMKQEYESDVGPLTDDCQSLQRFCVKFEHLLQTGLKDRSGVMTGKKDYWDYFRDCLSGNKYLKDGLHFVRSISELKSSLGRGRAFIRFALVHQRLADTMQQCLICQKHNRDWYVMESFVHQRGIREDLVTALYELNDLKLDLAPRGYDLDSAWPSFAHKSPHGMRINWKPPSRSSSITSLTSLPSLEVYHSQPARSLSPFNEHFTDAAASYGNPASDEMEDSICNDASDTNQLNHLAGLEQEIAELRACLEKERVDKSRITDLESEMLKIESTFRENEIRWQTEKDDLLNKISNLEMQAKHRTTFSDDRAIESNDGLDNNGALNENCVMVSSSQELVAELRLQLDEVLKTNDSLLIEVERLREERATLQETMQGLLQEKGRVSEFEKKLNDEKQELELKVEQLTLDLTASRDQLGTAKLYLQEASFCDAAYQDILHEKADFEDRISRLTEDLQCSNKNIQELTNENMSSNDRVVELLSLVARWELENERLTKELSQTRIELTDCRQAMHEMHDEKNLVMEVAQKTDSARKLEEARLLARISELNESLQGKDEQIAELNSQKITLQAECERIFRECENKQVECERLKDAVVKLEARSLENSELVDGLSTRVEELSVANENIRRETIEMEVKWRDAVNEKDHLVIGLKDDLEAMSGSVQRRERMWESARERMEQEIESLQSEITQKTADYQRRITVAEEQLRAVRADYEITQLQQQEELDDLKQCLGTAEDDISSLKYQIQQKDSYIGKLQAEKVGSIEQLSSDLKLMKSDNKQLRGRIIQLLKDKDNLWQKSNKLSNERRARRSNCWRNSAEIVKCMACNCDFTVTLRKHHCRECGRVFCWSCCNNWVQTAHSERKERVCNECVSDIHHVTSTSSGESDSGDEADEPSDSDDVTITSRDQLAVNYDGDGTLTAENNDIVSDDAQPPKVASAESLYSSGSWSVRNSARTAVSWVTGVVSRSLSSSTTGGMGASVTVDDCSHVVTSREPSSPSVVSVSNVQYVSDSNTTKCDGRHLYGDASLSKLEDYVPTTSDWLTNVNTLNQDCATATDNGVFLPPTDLETSQESGQLQSSTADCSEIVNDVSAHESLSSETVADRSSALTPDTAALTPCSASSDEAFDIITEEEVSECVRYPLPDPKVDCAQLIRCSELGNHLIESSNQVLIKAGRSYAVPISIDIPDFVLFWQFSTQPKGITFSLMYKECDIIPYRECDKLISDCKVNSHHHACEGQLEAHRAGVYTLLFDNTSSRFTAKQLQYKLELKRATRPSSEIV